MVTYILLALAALVMVIIALAATRPSELRVVRSARVKASPEAIYANISDFHRWNAWSPWEKLDPDLTRTFSGAPSGTGSVYEWKGNKKVGAGRMEIVDTSAPDRVVIKLDFLGSFESHNTTEFSLKPAGDGTDVTWTMYGPSSFAFKVFGLFFNMDKAIGGDFEKGLAGMRAIAEQPLAQP